ncbi:MAG: hypothetical protein ACRDRO_20775 [Pseudonocardiaceae bacterium]
MPPPDGSSGLEALDNHGGTAPPRHAPPPEHPVLPPPEPESAPTAPEHEPVLAS